MTHARLIAALLAASAIVALPQALQAQTSATQPSAAQPLIPGAAYDDSVPGPQSVLGYDFGERISRSADIRRYFEALRTAAPDRVVIGEQAMTHEGRPVFWAAIGSPANIARLDQIKAASRALADPRRTSPAQAAAIMADQPVIVWLAYSVHGDEISPADASMATARHLLASRDPAVQAWLANTVVVFVPTQNPDGRERFLNSNAAGFGTQPNPDPLSAERDQPWPGGRYNHDLFDLNRDWFIQTQPETRGHAAQIRDWRPQVLVDAHEMGTDETFFFPPEAQPLNPLIAPSTLASRELIGRNTARRFDQQGVDYFSRKVFDAFYPGYGDGWPGFLGAVSMTYEQGSSRGLEGRKTSGDILTYRETVRNHFIASLSTIEASSTNRDRLLNSFYDFHRDGVAGRGAYVFTAPAWDTSAADRLAGVLVASGVEVGRAEAGFSACGQTYPAGSYVVNLSQPARRMAEVLLARDIPVPADFLAQQEARRTRGLGHEIYDVTAWSLPLMFNVPSAKCGAAPGVAVTAATADRIRPRGVENPDPAYGFLVAPGVAGTGVMVEALKQGVSVRSMDLPFTQNGRRWPAGTLVIPRAGNPETLPALVSQWAMTKGAEIVGADESWVSDGASFGSPDAAHLKAPRVALAWDDPTDPTAVGAARYELERTLGYPVTVVRTPNLGRADLAGFDVIVLPDGYDYAGTLGEGGVTHLHDWVGRGGTLIGLGGATRLLTDPASKMLASRRETAVAEGEEAEGSADKARVPGTALTTSADYDRYVHGGEHGPDGVAGVLATAEVDPEHWLSAGVAPRLNFLVQGSDIYTPLKRDEGTNVARYTSAETLLASGQIWDQNRRQLAFKPAVMAAPQGEGWIIAFPNDPTFRGYMDGLGVIFANAVFRSSAH